MGVFEDVVVKAKVAADYAGKKTGEIVELTKIKFSIADLEDKIKTEFQQLGKVVYNAASEHTDATEIVREKSEKIDALYVELLKLRDKEAEIKEQKKCAECGAINPETAKFCQNCGAKL